MDFDHDGDYAYIDHFVGLTSADSFLSAWVKLDALGPSSEDDSAIFSSGAKDSHTTMLWYDFNGNDSGNPMYAFNVGQPSQHINRVDSGLNSVDANQWQHIVGSFAAGSKKIYVNGVLKSSQTGGTTVISPVGQRFNIGGWQSSDNNYTMNGLIDDLRVYSIELSQIQVSDIYGNGSDIGSPLVGGSLNVTAPVNGDRVLFGEIFLTGKIMHALQMLKTLEESLTSRRMHNGLPAIQFADDYLAMSNGDSMSFDGLETYTFLVVAKGKSTREDWMPVLSKRGDGGQGLAVPYTRRGCPDDHDDSGNYW